MIHSPWRGSRCSFSNSMRTYMVLVAESSKSRMVPGPGPQDGCRGGVMVHPQRSQTRCFMAFFQAFPYLHGYNHDISWLLVSCPRPQTCVSQLEAIIPRSGWKCHITTKQLSSWFIGWPRTHPVLRTLRGEAWPSIFEQEVMASLMPMIPVDPK